MSENTPNNDVFVTLSGLPDDSGSSYLRGPARAPGAIREAFLRTSSNLWTETGVDLGAPGIYRDAGDIALPEGAAARRAIRNAAAALFKAKAIPVFLGGDHAVTFPILEAAVERYPGLTVLHLDAHPDLYDTLDGRRHSHASPLARILETGTVGRVLQIGIRTLNGHQKAQAERFGVEIVPAGEPTASRIATLSGPLYLTIDLDVLDPAFAPGLSHPEPGGLSTRDVIRILHSVEAEIIGADIVELNPDRDPLGLTAMTAAKLLKELMGRIIRQRQGFDGSPITTA